MPLPIELLRHPGLWRAREQRGLVHGDAAEALPTGFAALDRCLPGGGWPRRGLVELLTDRCGIGELRLLMPALAALCRGDTAQGTDGEGGWLAWVSPPYQPYAPALAAGGIDVGRVLVVRAPGAQWAVEQALRSGACSAVLGWVDLRGASGLRGLRRLQLAAEQSRSLAVLFRPLRDATQSSPAVLRLALTIPAQAAPGSLELRIVKSRGGWPQSLRLELQLDDTASLAH